MPNIRKISWHSANYCRNNKCVSKTRTRHTRWAVKTMCDALATFFKGWQHLRRWLYHFVCLCLTYSKTVKINRDVECRWCMKNSTSIWPTTAGSNVPSTLGRYASYCVDHRRAIHKCRAVTHNNWSRVCHRWSYKNADKCNTSLLIMDFPGRLPPVTYIFRKLSSSWR